LKRPEIKQALAEFANTSGRDEVLLGILPAMVCELIPPTNEQGGCLTYAEVSGCYSFLW